MTSWSEAGRLYPLINVGDDLWGTVKVGDQITGTTWRGHLIGLAFNGSRSSAIGAGEAERELTGGTRVWVFLFVVGFVGLSLWDVFRRIRSGTTWGGRGW